jgi:arylsulfatase
VRWFSPEEYGNPSTLDELLATSDVALYDLVYDSGELENLAHPDHPGRDPVLIERMLAKLHALVAHELGEDRCPFDLDMFGTREITYQPQGAGLPSPTRGANRPMNCAIKPRDP